MSKMINIKGKEISEDTIVEALKKHINFQEQEIPKAGDKYSFGSYERLILKTGDKYSIVFLESNRLAIFSNDTHFATLDELIKHIKYRGYTKIYSI